MNKYFSLESYKIQKTNILDIKDKCFICDFVS